MGAVANELDRLINQPAYRFWAAGRVRLTLAPAVDLGELIRLHA